jgi:hypothetical protein
VKIRLRNSGFQVRSRSSFRDSSQQTEVAMALESALLFGGSPTAEGLIVEVGEPRRPKRKRMEVPLKVLFPLTEVTFLPDGQQQVTSLELRVAVRDEEGRRADLPVIPMVVRIDEDPRPGVYGRFDTTLQMRRLSHEAVVGVFDPASGRILSSSIEINP